MTRESLEPAGVLTVSLNNGHQPAVLDERVLRDVAEKSTAPDTRVLVLGGAGAFCEGLDLGAVADGSLTDFAGAVRGLGRVLEILATAPVPVIAVVDGPALGGGLGLAAVADCVVATPRARFGLPELLFGLAPAVVFPFVARRIGYFRARQLALSAQSVDAEAGLRMGLVDRLAEDWSAARSIAIAQSQAFLRCSRPAMDAFRGLLARYFDVIPEYQDAGVNLFDRLASDPEARQRMRSFLGGQSPWETSDA